MGRVSIVLAFGMVAAMAAARPGSDEMLELAAGTRIPFKLNDTDGLMLIDPGLFSSAACNPSFAVRAHLLSSWTGPVARIGPILVQGGAASYRFKTARGTFERMTRWSYNPVVDNADCGIGPGGLPDPVIRFVLHAPRPGEQVAALPFLAQSENDEDGSIDGRIDVGGSKIGVVFDLQRAFTRVTASAAWPVAEAQGGHLEGPVLQAPIAFGIDRPVRKLALARPLQVGPLTLHSLYVRVADFGDASHIRTNVDPEELDPEAITVTGHVKHSRYFQRLKIGAGDLERCSSITFDKRERKIMLSCV
jgi:hypothetical protein